MEHVVEVATKIILGVKLGRASPYTIHHKLELLLGRKDKKSCSMSKCHVKLEEDTHTHTYVVLCPIQVHNGDELVSRRGQLLEHDGF